jgi:hypothetical protein
MAPGAPEITGRIRRDAEGRSAPDVATRHPAATASIQKLLSRTNSASSAGPAKLNGADKRHGLAPARAVPSLARAAIGPLPGGRAGHRRDTGAQAAQHPPGARNRAEREERSTAARM